MSMLSLTLIAGRGVPACCPDVAQRSQCAPNGE